MERRTNLAIAGGITIALAAVAAAIAVNVGLLSDRSAADGPGTFQPTSAIESISTSGDVGTGQEMPATTAVPALPLDDDEYDDHRDDDDHDEDSSGHGSGHDDDD